MEVPGIHYFVTGTLPRQGLRATTNNGADLICRVELVAAGQNEQD